MMPDLNTSARPTPPRSPGRPRSPEVDQAILQATLELLAEIGYRALSMEQVRARAGVGKATIYRRYASKDDLVKAAIAHLHFDLHAPPDTGSLASDFSAASSNAIGAAEVTGAAAIVPRLLAETAHDRELHRLFHEGLVEPRRALIRTILTRAVKRGEVRKDVDMELAIDMLVGPIIYRFLMDGELATLRERSTVVVDSLLRGLG